MRATRRAAALTALAAAGGVTVLGGLPAEFTWVGPAAAAGAGRIEVSARADAMYIEGASGSIPASPRNDASSLLATVQLSTFGGGTASASTPFFGSTAQNLPGTANGAFAQNGFKEVQFPFTRLPGFVTCRDTGDENGQFGYGRVNAKCGGESSEAHGSQGAPPEIPAPNQQETADAITRITEDGTGVAEATGTVKGVVMGPLEIGQAIATATIRSTAGNPPEITSSTSGTFSVSGQKFGFTENGIVFAGQTMSQADALKQADEALKAAGIGIEMAPVAKNADEASGQVRYTVGGLKVTWTQPGSELVYIVPRASVTAVNESFATTLAPGTTAAPSADMAPGTGGDTSYLPAPGGFSSPTISNPVSRSESFSTPSLSPDNSSGTATTAAAPAPDAPSEAALAPPTAGPTTLGLMPTAGRAAGNHTGWLYLMIVLGAVAVVGGQAALSRFAVGRG
jgi:hypothetical protein